MLFVSRKRGPPLLSSLCFLHENTQRGKIARVKFAEELGTMSKNRLRWITLVRGPIWGIHSLTLMISSIELTAESLDETDGPTGNKSKGKRKEANRLDSSVKKAKKWAWTPEAVEVLLRYIKEYKTKCDFNGVRFPRFCWQRQPRG